MNILEIKNVKKSFNDSTLHVLKDISLTSPWATVRSSADVLATGDKLTLRGAAHTAECTVTSVEELNESTQKL